MMLYFDIRLKCCVDQLRSPPFSASHGTILSVSFVESRRSASVDQDRLRADTVEKLDSFLIEKKVLENDLSESPVLNDLLLGNAFRYPEFH
jgi:hypothetical protein